MSAEPCTHPAHASSPGDLRDAIRALGLRATSARVAVLGCLREAQRPLSHAEVMAQLDEGAAWDRATVYRNLADLARVGLLHRYDLGDHVWRFELATDPCAHGHHEEAGHAHFQCTECGDVQCLPGVALALAGIEGAPASVRQQAVDVQLRGRCDDCG